MTITVEMTKHYRYWEQLTPKKRPGPANPIVFRKGERIRGRLLKSGALKAYYRQLPRQAHWKGYDHVPPTYWRQVQP